MQLKAIMCDADGVLIIPPERFSKRLEREHGILESLTKQFFDHPFQKCMIGENDLKDALKPYLDDWGWKKSVDDFLLYWFESENYPNNELLEHIGHVRDAGVKCYLATNQEEYRTEFIRLNMGFDSKLDGIFSSAYATAKKPNVLFWAYCYSWIANDLGTTESNIVLAPSHIMYFDDAQNNVDEACLYGFKSHLYNGLEDFCKIVESELSRA